MQISKFLKFVFAADAISCLGMGAALAIGAQALAPLFGLTEGLVLGAGLTLLPIGLFIAYVAMRDTAPGLFVAAIILGNVMWVVESLMVAEQTGITTLGTIFVIGQAAAVAGIAALETVGGLRARRAVPVAC